MSKIREVSDVETTAPAVKPQTEVIVLPPGVNDNIAMSAYLAQKALSAGVCHTLNSECPLEAWLQSPWNPGREDSPNNASDAGTVAHAALLEGSFKSIAVIDPNDHPAEKTGNIPDGWTNKSIRTARDDARARGLTPILKTEMPKIEAMVEAAQTYIARSEFAGIFKTGKPEQTVIWDDGGTLCKARSDWLNDEVCMHFKTSKRSVRPETFGRLAINMGYDISVAFYARGIERPHHLILAQQQTGSFACKWFALSSEQFAISSHKTERTINAWRECVRRKEFPAYTGDVHYIEPTPWQMEQALEDGDIEGLGYADDIAGQGVQA